MVISVRGDVRMHSFCVKEYDTALFKFSLYYVYYALVVLQLILHSFAEKITRHGYALIGDVRSSFTCIPNTAGLPACCVLSVACLPISICLLLVCSSVACLSIHLLPACLLPVCSSIACPSICCQSVHLSCLSVQDLLPVCCLPVCPSVACLSTGP